MILWPETTAFAPKFWIARSPQLNRSKCARPRRPTIVALVAAYLFSFGSVSGKDAFPSRPLDRTQVLVWMDFGESIRRVKKLINRAGIDFEPTSEYLALLKTLGAPTDFVDALGKTQAAGTTSTYPAEQDAAFGHLSSCLTLARKGQVSDAVKECQTATGFEPSVTYFALADVLMRQRKVEDAVAALRLAEKANPSIPETHNLLGLALGDRGDKRAAKKEFQKAIKIDPDYDSPYNNLGYLALQERDLKTADEEFRQALRVDPDSASAHNNLAAVRMMRHNLDGGIAEMRKAVQLEPESAFRHSGLAEALMMKKDYEGAVGEFRQALALEPKRAEWHAKLALILWQLQRRDQAVAECQAAGQGAGFDDRIRTACEAIHQQVSLSTSQPSAQATASSMKTETSVPVVRLPQGMRGAGWEVVEKVQTMRLDEFAATQDKATHGDAEAQTLVCIAYRLGRFVPRDDAQGLAWCEKAAKQNNLLAESDVGLQYAYGLGVARDTVRGLEWLKKAASQGSNIAIGNLGTVYANGLGVPQDYAEAMKWYQVGANHGDARSETDIGIMYLLGQGVRRDPAEGLRWFRKAADKDYAYADSMLGMAYQQGWGVPRDLNESLKWIRKAADLGDPSAQTELGWIYANGIGVQRDLREAVRWYRKSAEQGDPHGAYGLGVRYLTGQGVSKDYAEAEKWFRVAADGGHGDAAYNLALLCLGSFPGQAGQADNAQAAKYFRMAANQGIGDGQCYLGKLYADGRGLMKDDVSAYQWMLLASQNGAEQCMQALKTIETEMKPEQVDEAKRRAAAWKPQPHPGFTY
jgi:uncharacterized protein